jgi:hypothetical protein
MKSAGEKPQGGTTERVLAQLRLEEAREQAHGDVGAGARHGAHDREEDGEHGEEGPDERWLVSYADMMTLLFGLFVMLYSMANRFEEVQSSVAQRFSGKQSAAKLDLAAIERQLEEDRARIEAARVRAKALEDELNTTKEALRVSEARSDELKRELEKAQAKLAGLKVSPVAIVMRWSTAEHDVDLVVEDPAGREFNFKVRRHEKHPGLFVLDSRRGPGAEVWQSETILRGTYKAHVVFYNPYGNRGPAKITTSVLTSKGSFDYPEMTLQFGKSSQVTVRFSAEPDGSIKLLP